MIENRAGATGAIGTQAVVSAPPDGHTLLMGQTGEIAINQHWIKGLTYNAEKDLVPVALASVVPLALVVPAKAPYSTMAELAKALADKQPLTFASAGTGTPGHFAGEFLKLRTKANLTHVPYKGAGPALNDLLGGHVDMYFPGFPAATPLLKGRHGENPRGVVGQARQRRARHPDRRRGDQRSELRSDAVAGLLRAGRHAAPIVSRLNGEINTILASPSMQAKLRDAGADVRIGSSAQFARFRQGRERKVSSDHQGFGREARVTECSDGTRP